MKKLGILFLGHIAQPYYTWKRIIKHQISLLFLLSSDLALCKVESSKFIFTTFRIQVWIYFHLNLFMAESSNVLPATLISLSCLITVSVCWLFGANK